LNASPSIHHNDVPHLLPNNEQQQSAEISNPEERYGDDSRRENFKRESTQIESSQSHTLMLDDDTASTHGLSGQDLFHFNKLSKNLNSIPSSSSSSSSVYNKFSPTHGSSVHQEKGKHYQPNREDERPLPLRPAGGEEMLNGVNLVLREHLASFRLTLNKLMNRLADHNYQHNVLTNQLLLVKDECSLAANYGGQMWPADSNVSKRNGGCPSPASLCDTSKSSHASSLADQEAGAEPEQQQHHLMRSSDATMIVRLLSKELGQLLDERLQQTIGSSSVSPITSRQQALLQQQVERQQHLEPLVERELGSIRRRLDEIDSVVKQTALLMSKWSSFFDSRREFGGRFQSGASSSTVSRATCEPVTIVTYSNASNASEPVEREPPSEATSGRPQPETRWFSGSKVPNRPAPLQQQQQQSGQRQQQSAGPKCVAKTSLIRPTSCRQLRLAGANCTGQYYVFIGGSIRHVYCDMNMDPLDEGGGWTVVLRRIDKSLPASLSPNSNLNSNSNSNLSSTRQESEQKPRQWNRILESFRAAQVNFSLDWHNYKSGFGYHDEWSEFFLGLDLLHLITGHQSEASPSTAEEAARNGSGAKVRPQGIQLQFDLEFAPFSPNGSHEGPSGIGLANETSSLGPAQARRLSLRFDHFRLLDEQSGFAFVVGASKCKEHERALCEPVLSLNGRKFATRDRLLQDAANCSQSSPVWPSNMGGWWFSERQMMGQLCPNETRNETSFFTDQLPFSLTNPIGKQQEANVHLYWPNATHLGPLRQLVMKVRDHEARL